MKKIYIPSNGPESWKQFLAEPDKQWKKGYSARSLAYSWEDANGFPKTIFNAMTNTPFETMTPLIIIPEHKVDLPPAKGRPSQNDIWVLGKTEDDLVSIAVEGKVSEPFGPTIKEWSVDASDGKKERLSFLKTLLNLDNISDDIRYQLLHRTASAILEAQKYNAKYAVMLIHSFNQESLWFDDYKAFARLFGIEAEIGSLFHAGKISNKELYLGWVKGAAKYLEE